MTPLLALALVAGLADRPADLAGPDPTAYSQWLAGQAMRADSAFARTVACVTAKASSEGMDPMPKPVLAKATAMRDEAAGPVVIEHVRVTACGRDWRQNIVSYRLKNGGWKASMLLPGDSRADYFAQREVLNVMIQVAPVGLSPTTCDETEQRKTLKIGAARVTAPPNDQGVWKEVWSVTVCEQSRPVEVTFTPKAGGDVDFDYRPLWK